MRGVAINKNKIKTTTPVVLWFLVSVLLSIVFILLYCNHILRSKSAMCIEKIDDHKMKSAHLEMAVKSCAKDMEHAHDHLVSLTNRNLMHEQQLQQRRVRELEEDAVSKRDRAVNADPLYPPLNREPKKPPFYEEDTYRLVGYLVNTNGDKEDTWKLFGREKRKGMGEFYLVSANKNMDVKIAITENMVVGSNGARKLRDIYDIPDELSIVHPMFSREPYQVIVNPHADIGSSRIYT